MFGWNDFGIDGKRWEENKRENSWGMCLVGRWRERENSWGATIFSSGPPNYNLSKIERKQERNFCACEKNIWSLVLRYSFFLFFSFSTPPTSFIHFGLLFIFFYFLFLVSSCFPFYASIFFSFFFTSFLFLFLFFKKNLFTRFCILFLLLSPFFFFLNYNMDASFLLFLNWRICFSFLEYGCS